MVSAPLGPTCSGARSQSRGALLRSVSRSAAPPKAPAIEQRITTSSLQLPKLARIITRVAEPHEHAMDHDHACMQAQTAQITAVEHDIDARRRGGEESSEAAGGHTEWRGRPEEALRDLKLISAMLKSGDRARSSKTRRLVR